MNDDATQFSYFQGNELTQIADISISDENGDKIKALEEGSIFLNKYKILKVLGEGSFSLIYLLEAIDVSKKLLVAKEFFPKGFVTRNQHNEVIVKTSLSKKEKENFHFMKDIFIGEAQNLVKVSKRTHPNVLSFFALEENVNNTMYLITDYEEGMTLKAYVEQRKKEHTGKMTNEEIRELATGLLDALDHIHKVNVYHQDIKLENILIRQDNYPLLLDFGASIILYDKKKEKHFNAITPRYAAPEQVELSQPPTIDQRTDIYELGVLLYKLITDEFPPKASERIKAQTEYKDSYIPLETQKSYGYDISLLKAVDRALELEQEKRFQNAVDFKKALLPKKIAFFNLKTIGLLLLIPFLFGLMYMFWPKMTATVKLNVDQEKYFVYSDGEKVLLSEEKTILLSNGKHQLTLIKDGYIPYEVNVTVTPKSIMNVSATLVPLAHKVTLSANVPSPSFSVNGKKLHENSFNAQVGGIYSIQTEAENFLPAVSKNDYRTLHQSDFKFYQELSPVKTKVTITVENPLKIGSNTVKINGKTLHDNTFLAEYNKRYQIDIENPYYKKVHLERTYDELNTKKALNITMKPGYGVVILKGLPTDVSIEVYQKDSNKMKLVSSMFTYFNQMYKSKLEAHEKIYLKLSKEGYEIFRSDMIRIEHNSIYEKVIKLRKKIAEKKPEEKNENNTSIEIGFLDTIKEKTEDVKVEKKIQKKSIVRKTMLKQKSNKRIKTVKYKIKSRDTLFSIARAHKTSVKEVKRYNNLKRDMILKTGTFLTVPVNNYVRKKEITYNRNIKKKKVLRNRKIKKKSSYIWYCISASTGTDTWSAKASTKQQASSSALSKCHRKKSSCRVSNCYILGNSYNY
ncbi:MAG: protein kinase [Sulfurovum sp.]|nr:protein kinase [Sulfurovum sp.]